MLKKGFAYRGKAVAIRSLEPVSDALCATKKETERIFRSQRGKT